MIGILAAIVIVAYSGIQDRAKAAAAQSAVSQVAKKLSAHAVQNSDTYPETLADAGISNSGDTSYQYSVNNSVLPRTFCVTATTQDASYFASSTNSTPTSGGCPGHGVGGVAAVTNQFQNPNFLGPNGPTNYAGTVDLAIVDVNGTQYAQAEATTASTASMRLSSLSPRWSISSGQDVFARAIVRNPNASTRNYSLVLRFYDAAGATAGNVLSPSPQSTITPIASGGTTTLSVAGTAPPNTASVAVTVSRNTGNGPAIGDLIQATTVWLSDVDAPFATGDSPGWIWNGTPNASTSTGPPQ